MRTSRLLKTVARSAKGIEYADWIYASFGLLSVVGRYPNSFRVVWFIHVNFHFYFHSFGLKCLMTTHKHSKLINTNSSRGNEKASDHIRGRQSTKNPETSASKTIADSMKV